jgi:hypothetical protein
MTIAVPTSGGWTLEAQLEEDEHGMLWLIWPNRAPGEWHGRHLLTAALKVGWRILESTPEERALLEAHGSQAGGCSDRCSVQTACHDCG